MKVDAQPAPDVSRETKLELATYASLLRKWNKRINLVSSSTIEDLEDRHINDCIQLWSYAPKTWRHWVDLGSGGGLPGLVIAILAKESDRHVTLVESDKRKATFLRQVIRTQQLPATVLDDRIEVAQPDPADVISARALAPLDKLLDYAQPHSKPDTTFLFPKGRNAAQEIQEAQHHWRFDLGCAPSLTSAESTILILRNIARD